MEIIEIQPDLVITSGGARSAFVDIETSDKRTMRALVEGMVDHRETLSDYDIPVLTIIDNPRPEGQVYKCVAENPDNLQACSFDLEAGVERSGAVALMRAVEAIPGSQYVDLTDRICTRDLCPPVIGNVLVYRQGSHLTDTYVRSLTHALEDRLVPIVEQLIQNHS